MSLKFKLHVIPPPFPLDWTSPRKLLVKTLLHHFIQDPAPIGHFFIEFQTATPNAYGVSHVLTGMSRLKRNQSTLTVIKEKVGLGTFFYDFEGKLDDARQASLKLQWAKKKRRLKTLTVDIAPEQSQILMDELDLWIKHGSFKHYGGGGLSILDGEGSGCAEFGMHFFNLAVGKRAAHPAWIRKVHAPKPLTGGRLTGNKVTLTKLFRDGHAWAENEEDGFLYTTPDMDLVTEWLKLVYPNQKEIHFNSEALPWALEAVSRICFQAGYRKIDEAEVKIQWKRVGMRK
ncbi:MAG: hypothetical protein H7333_09970 [Bdellovibrionales bacterium]|nr:hypothetical protein [Oligoflexia bacterium]